METSSAAAALLLLCLALCSCGPGACAGGDKVDRLTAQLEGACCEFSTAPTNAQPDSACKVIPAGSLLSIRNERRECIRWAAGCLGELGPGAGRAVPELIAAVRSGPNNYDTGDGVIPVRDAIVEALGRTGAPQAVPVLLEALENPRPVEAGPGAVGYASKEPVGEEAVLTALGLLGPVASPSVPKILPFLKRPIASPHDLRTVQGAAAALGAINDPVAIPALIDALGRKEEDAIPAVANALGEFGPSAAPALPALTRLIAAVPDRPANGAIRRAIRNIAGKGAASALPKSYEETTSDVAKLMSATAKKVGVRLAGVRIDGPNQEVSITLPSGMHVHAGFDKQSWLARRVVKGSVVVRRDGAVVSRAPYEGLAQLESLLTRILLLQ